MLTPTLGRYLEFGRLHLDNRPAEQSLRPLAVGSRSWLHNAGDGGLASAAVLLSLAASAKRHRKNPWPYVKHILEDAAARPKDADWSGVLPDAWAQTRPRPGELPGYAADLSRSETGRLPMFSR